MDRQRPCLIIRQRFPCKIGSASEYKRILMPMNARNLFRLCSSVMALAIAPTLSADPTAPGTYRHWDGDIDQVVIISAFRADDYQDIHVEPLDITKTAVPDRKGESRPATLALLPSLKPAFMDGLQKNLRRRSPASS